ncbi:MAG TPA: XRE family transcriptional regulator [Coriobacteriia bacterium]|jgi:Zn-dependent peptidase ImmA (M78 family)/DNA-binding XRE family transcriptional regulator
MLNDRLRQLRLARGLTLDELAELMGGKVTKQALSKYENGKAFPRPTTLVAVAQALNVKVSELMGEPEYHIDCLQYRTRAPLPVRTKERVEAALRVDLERRLRLEDRLFAERQPGIRDVRREVSTEDEVEVVATNLREAWGLGTEPISSLSEVLERNSIHVFELDGEVDLDGLACVARTKDGRLRAVGIAENPDAQGDRQRFTLAHELGHVVLEPGDLLEEECMANRFAGAFLMPVPLVFGEVGERRTDVSLDELLLLRQRWGVSIQSILHRLRDLGVISQAHYEWWWREIKAAGYEKVEPGPLLRESSTWEKRQLARAEAEGLLSREQAASYVTAPSPLPQAQVLDRRALMRLSLEDRRAVLREHAEAMAQEYGREIDRDWLEADLDDE